MEPDKPKDKPPGGNHDSATDISDRDRTPHAFSSTVSRGNELTSYNHALGVPNSESQRKATHVSIMTSTPSARNGPGHEGVTSSNSFGSSLPSQLQAQQSKFNEMIRGSQAQGTLSPHMTNQQMTLLQKSSFDGNLKNRISPSAAVPNRPPMNEQVQMNPGVISSDNSHLSTLAPPHRSNGNIGNHSIASPLGASPSVPKPSVPSIKTESNVHGGPRPVTTNTGLQHGTGLSNNGREYGSSPFGAPTLNMGSFTSTTTSQQQLSGTAVRAPANNSAKNTNGTTQPVRVGPQGIRPGIPPNGPRPPDHPNSNLSTQHEHAGPPLQIVSSNPTGFNKPVVGSRQNQPQAQQIPSFHGLQNARRQLPMTGNQPRRGPPAGTVLAHQQTQGSPGPVSSAPPPGRVMAYRSPMDEQQHPRIQTSLQQHPPLQNSAPQQVQSPYNGGGRELRVEDALVYLDDVKNEFKDRPAIYNDFLAIMKNFKSQEVDTPGVIARVSELFRGYNKLILGFNTFLPDGYKISLADLERQDAERLNQEAAERKSKPNKTPGPRTGPKARKTPVMQGENLSDVYPAVSHPAPPPQKVTVQLQQQQQQQQQQQEQQQQQQQQQQDLQQQNAKRAQHQAALRAAGLDDGVPPGRMLQPPNQGNAVRPAPLAQVRPPVLPQQNILHPKNLPIPQPMPVQTLQNNGVPPRAPPHAPPNAQHQAATPLPQQQTVEFDHAFSYVTTIKKRFANDARTYHAFLDILHTYQREQRGIKEVLEQVAHLFQDHPDLLTKFTFFLPDAVQEQAKERLNRAVAESESRHAASRQLLIEQYQQNMVGQQIPSQAAVDTVRRQAQHPEPEIRGRKRQVDGIPLPMISQPEPFVYNSAVERQFFDSTREALSSSTRDGGQAWAEFLRCLDLYAQEVLSRTEMLNLIEPLLGKKNTILFEEFKRILSAAGTVSGSMASIEDSWYSVPLADIDFSRCRRCSPSYRALPRDYPAHPCSERSDLETKVLNDVWVSLPVGSEESYTFRHMRRNNYEEILFRIEDERFEIDMVIDTNAATIHRLDPIAEEIAQLSRVDVVPHDLRLQESDIRNGLGGKKFQYTFDKSVLGVIHRNSIARIYGDSGKEMLKLLHVNPTVAIPLVLNRLKQKQTEWIKVRNRLSRYWKELAEQNYYKSLDHRSLTWRTIDKRAISTKTLIAEIKDRSANDGNEGSEAFRQKLDKAKEEHGTFYETTVGSKLNQDIDVTLLPKPDRRIFTPHITIMYENVSWAQRDAYRILAFSLERGPISPDNKERCHRLWVEFLGPWFGLPLGWMQKPAVDYQDSFVLSANSREPVVVSEDDEDGTLFENLTDHHPLPAGALVSTLYGDGKILEFRRTDSIYKVELVFGAVAYLRTATVLCSVSPVENSSTSRELRGTVSDRTVKFRPHDQLVFGRQFLYVFFRLHNLLVQRLNIAKKLAYSVGSNSSLQSMVERIPCANPKVIGRLRYEAYLSLLYSLLDGGMSAISEGGKYEDRLRSLLGHDSYELATMDKLISHTWKQIQEMALDDNMWKIVHAYRRQLNTGAFHPESFKQEAVNLSDGEPMYAFQHCWIPDTDNSIIHMEYLGVIADEDDDPMEEAEIEIPEQTSNKRPKK